MGLVYRARQRHPDRIVAIKLIAPELAADPAFRARFEQESNTAAQIEHPNVIPVYEVGEEGGLLYIAMRYVDGVDLGGLLANSGPLRPERAAHFVSQVAGALDAAHARGLVHRDVKPGNILVAAGDHVYLTDFGLTKRIGDTRGQTATGMFVGTVDYIAPEQIEGHRIDARADVYALGCVAYQMLSGEVPFPRESELAKLYAHVNDSPPPLQGVPAPLAAAVKRAMAKRPADRFLSAGDFGRAVIAGAAGRADQGAGRAVATRGAAIADEQAPTEAGSRTPTELAQTGPTRLDEAPATGEPPTASRRGPLPFSLVAVGAATLVAVIGAAVAIALGSGGSGSTSSTTHSTRSSSTTVRTTPTQNSSRATLAPAFSPPSVDECQQQLTFGADGTASPVKCANGDVNVVAWRYYARVAGHILAAGAFANPAQAIQAMCKDTNSTIPIEQMAYQLAQTYYGWQFAVDPSSEYPSSCH
jgi:serine/threonine protein kinase